jgi:hypothetical protein
MLMSIPIVSPIEITFRDVGVRRLPAPDEPDYEVHALPASRTPAQLALDEIEHATQVSEYHDFSWWDERLRIVRAALERAEGRV